MKHITDIPSARITIIFFLTFLAFELFAPVAVAEHAQARLLDHLGEPFINIPYRATASNSSSTLVDSTNELGIADLYLTDEATVSFSFQPSKAKNCASCSVLKDRTIEETISFSSEKFNATTGKYSIGDVQLEQYTRLVKIVVKDTKGEPFVGETIYATRVDGTDIKGTTDSEGAFTFGAEPGKVYIGARSNDGNFAYESKTILVPETDSITTQIDFILERTDSSITIDFKDEQGNPYLAPEGSRIGVSCSTDDYKLMFYGTISTGESSGTIKVVGGTSAPRNYICGTMLMEAGTSQASTSISTGENKSVTITTYELSYELYVKFVDQNGTPLNIPAFISASTGSHSPVKHFVFTDQSNSEGNYLVKLVPNRLYEIRFEGIEDEEIQQTGIYSANNDSKYVSSFQKKEFETSDDSPGEVTFVLQEADVTFDILVTKDGNPIASAWVDASSDSKAHDGPLSLDEGITDVFVISGFTDANGKARLYGKSGLSYLVNASIPSSLRSTSINPAPIKVAPESGTVNIELKVQKPDFILHLTLITPETLSWSSCAAFNTEADNYGTVEDLKTSLALVRSALPYKIICHGGTKSQVYSSQIIEYVPPAEASEDSLSVDLTIGSKFFPPEEYHFDASESQELTLPDDCSRIEIPAGALGTGQVTLTMGTNDIAVPFTEGIQPFNLFRINASDEKRVAIKKLKEPATLAICYDEEALPEGLAESELTCVGSNEFGTGLSAKGCSIDTEANQATFTVSHFSSYGLNRSRSVTGSSISAPPEVKVKRVQSKRKKKIKRAQIRWLTILTADSYILRVTRTTKKSQKTSKKSVKATKKSMVTKFVKLSRPGTYTFSVASVKSSGEQSAFTTGATSLTVRKKKK